MTYQIEALRDLLEWAEAGGDRQMRFHQRWMAARRDGENGRPYGDFYNRAVMVAGWTLDWRLSPGQRYDVRTPLYGASRCSRDGVQRDIRELAQEVLGISDEEAQILFGLDRYLYQGMSSTQGDARTMDLLRALLRRYEEFGRTTSLHPDALASWSRQWMSRHNVYMP